MCVWWSVHPRQPDLHHSSLAHERKQGNRLKLNLILWQFRYQFFYAKLDVFLWYLHHLIYGICGLWYVLWKIIWCTFWYSQNSWLGTLNLELSFISRSSYFFFLQQNCVHYTDLGQKIGKEPGVVYVSTTQGRKWMELAEFAQNRDGEDYLFLEHQLELFGDLCHVSVKFCNFWRTVCFVNVCNVKRCAI